MDLQLPRDFTPARADEILQRARPALNLPEDARLSLDGVKTTARGTEIKFSGTAVMPLEGEQLGAAAGVNVDVNGRGSLQFDKQGKLTGATFQPLDPKQLVAIRDNVSKMIAANQVYFARPGEAVSPDKLRAAGKPWYVQEDEHGRRRLKRAYMS